MSGLDGYTAVFRGAPTAVRYEGTALDDEARVALLNRLRTEHIELDVDIVAFAQSQDVDEILNDRWVVLEREALDELAESAEGNPFLRDHGRGMEDKGGHIVASRIEDTDGCYELRQTAHLSAAWAVRGVLDRTISSFSVYFTGAAICSVCSSDIWRCEHWPGEFVDVDGAPVRVLMVYTTAKHCETSAVVFPGCQGTRIDDCRTALAALRREYNGHEALWRGYNDEALRREYNGHEERGMATQNERTRVSARTLQALELSAAADSHAVESAVMKLADELTGARTSIDELSEENAALSAKLDAQGQAAEEAFIQRALDAGKVLKDTPIEATLRRMFQATPEDAQQLLASLAVVHPGKKPHPLDLPEPKGEPPKPPIPDDDMTTREHAVGFAEMAGMSREEFERFAPKE